MSISGPTEPELAPGLSYRSFLDAARAHRTEADFRASAFFRAHGAVLERLLLTPRIEPAPPAQTVAGSLDRPPVERPLGPIRVLHWNIEKGRELSRIIDRLRDDAWMREADLVLLNEVDNGTARGGKVDQARALAGALGFHHAWLPTYLECTNGTGADLLVPGENTLGMHGLAILSRWPIVAARGAELPPCHDYFDFHEKRFGGRRGLYVLVEAPAHLLVAATTHLEVRNTPRCRERQFAAFLRGLDDSLREWQPAGGGSGKPHPGLDRFPVILGGDWNTNSFRRGGLPNSVVEFARLVTTPAEMMAGELVRPFAREPLFALLAAGRFDIASCNDSTPTVEQELGRVEDLAMLPRLVARGVDRAFRLSGRVLRMRLDWLAVRGLQAKGRPVTLPAKEGDGRPWSDHAAIGVDVTGR